METNVSVSDLGVNRYDVRNFVWLAAGSALLISNTTQIRFEPSPFPADNLVRFRIEPKGEVWPKLEVNFKFLILENFHSLLDRRL